jgi:hypothetical protein
MRRCKKQYRRATVLSCLPSVEGLQLRVSLQSLTGVYVATPVLTASAGAECAAAV